MAHGKRKPPHKPAPYRSTHAHKDAHHSSHSPDSSHKLVNSEQMSEAFATCQRAVDKAEKLASHAHKLDKINVISQHLAVAQGILEHLEPTHGGHHSSVSVKALRDADKQVNLANDALKHHNKTPEVERLISDIHHLIALLDDLIHIEIVDEHADHSGHSPGHHSHHSGSETPPPIPKKKRRHHS